ncbi:LysM peptidoglycan-binding domain-containing protein [Candidatus Zixiibacteriota bacterium]
MIAVRNESKRAILCAAICVCAVAPRQALAQAESVGASADTIRGTIHTVQKGDTLWDLSQHYLSDSWLWPTVHQANAGTIENPHLIYPGQKIWFPAGGGTPVVLSFEEVWPDRDTGIVEAARQAMEIPLPEPDPDETPADQPAVTQDPPLSGDPEVSSTGFVGREERYYPLASRNAILAAGHLGNPSNWPDGEIVGGEGADMNMSLYDQAFLNLGEDDTQPGDLYMVVEAGPMVRHPEWGHRLDRKIHIKGIIQIVDVEARTSQGVLVAVFDAVGKQDRVIPAPAVDARPWKEFIPVQGGRTGFVVARATADGNMHPYEMLFIDGGEEEGVQVGDLYVLKRPESERGRLRFFEQELARVVVIAVQEKTATVMILSLKDSNIGPGEVIELIGRSVFVESGGEGGEL